MIYLLHLSRPFKGVRHYMGATADLETRLSDHRAGRGSDLLKAVNRAGISYRVVRKWRGLFATEKKLKRRYKLADLCPVCSGPHVHKRG